MPAAPAPGRRRHVSADPEAARAFLEQAYGSRTTLTVLDPAGRPYRLTHTEAHGLAGGELVLPGRLRLVSGPPALLVVATVRSGRLTLRVGREEYPLTAGQTFLDGRYGRPRTARTEDLELRTVAIPWDTVRTAARRAHPGDDRPVRFTGLLPCDAAHATLWRRTAEFAHRTLLAQDLPVSPRVAAEAARLLAATALCVFPNTALAPPPQGPRRPAAGTRPPTPSAGPSPSSRATPPRRSASPTSPPPYPSPPAPSSTPSPAMPAPPRSSTCAGSGWPGSTRSSGRRCPATGQGSPASPHAGASPTRAASRPPTAAPTAAPRPSPCAGWTDGPVPRRTSVRR
ncbi:hypothetical protein GCM10010302_64450 [Streptomyces polychromogenes]|uniref:Uncharacterized protein n=1 Tax=Streptomyces polychromogenes TaxID=67342 RepID=A0ABP3FHR8_9ACTN